jgi:sugar lactone lactonase YvrE
MKESFDLVLIMGVVFLSFLFVQPSAHSAPGDLYLADSGSDSIFKYTANGIRSTFATGLRQAVALAFDRQGNLFVVDSGSGIPQTDSTIVKFAPDGTQSTFANLGLTAPLSMAFDGAGNLFVSFGASIDKFSPDGTQSTFSDADAWPLAFDKSANLYAAINTSGDQSIMKFAPDGTSSTFVSFSGPGQSTSALAFDQEGNLFAERGGEILKITPDGIITTFATGEFQPNCLAFDTDGNLFAGLNALNSSEPAIVKFAPDGTQTTFANGVLRPAALAFEPVTEKLRNISARGLVGTGNDVLIGGFIVGGNALANNAVLLRAIGPSLSGSGVSNPLADPTLELHNASGAVIASNDDWQDTQEELISGTGIPPTDPSESAIYATLPAGNYTAVVRGAGDTTGTALVEVYSINQ